MIEFDTAQIFKPYSIASGASLDLQLQVVQELELLQLNHSSWFDLNFNWSKTTGWCCYHVHRCQLTLSCCWSNMSSSSKNIQLLIKVLELQLVLLSRLHQCLNIFAFKFFDSLSNFSGSYCHLCHLNKI